ncbi:hypothetical protein D4759_25670 [Clostridiales bacterium AHG0011]|nr:hypothetical protein [Clostridiales bacterium AHG0011]
MSEAKGMVKNMRGKFKRKFAVVMASVLALSNIQSIPVFAGGGVKRRRPSSDLKNCRKNMRFRN